MAAQLEALKQLDTVLNASTEDEAVDHHGAVNHEEAAVNGHGNEPHTPDLNSTHLAAFVSKLAQGEQRGDQDHPDEESQDHHQHDDHHHAEEPPASPPAPASADQEHDAPSRDQVDGNVLKKADEPLDDSAEPQHNNASLEDNEVKRDLSLEEELEEIRAIRRQASNHDEVKREVEATSRPLLSKASMTTSIDTESVRAAYEDVRSDASDTEWAVFKFQDQNITCSASGVGFSGFRSQFHESERAFGFIRIQTGDEMSKRQKFVFITWVGPQVSVIRRAKMSIDKAMVKDIVKNFAVELQLESLSEVDVDYFREQLSRVGGANYGTGVREL